MIPLEEVKKSLGKIDYAAILKAGLASIDTPSGKMCSLTQLLELDRKINPVFGPDVYLTAKPLGRQEGVSASTIRNRMNEGRLEFKTENGHRKSTRRLYNQMISKGSQNQ